MAGDLDLGTLMVGLGADVKALRQDTSEATSLLEGFTKDSKKLGEQVGEGFFAAAQKHWAGIIASIAIGQVALSKLNQIGREFVETFQREQKTLAFENLAGSIGENAQKIISSLKIASGSIISTGEAISVASRAMLLGLDPTTIVKLMEVARASTKATGQTIEAAFYDVTLGVARQSKMILDNLGIILDYDKHLRKMQNSLGKTELQLTDAERRQAFLNATLEAGDAIIRRVGTGSETLADAYQEQAAALKDSVSNLKDMVFHGNEFVEVMKGLNNTLKILAPIMEFTVREFRDMGDALGWLLSPLGFFWEKLKEGSNTAGEALDNFLGYNKALKETQTLIKNSPRQVGQLQFSFPKEFEGIVQRQPKGDMTPEEAKKWAEDYAKLVDKTAENTNKAALATIENEKRLRDEALTSARDIEESYADMYEALKFDTERYYEFQKGLLVKRREEEIKITGDIALAWEAYYARLQELDEQRALRGNDVLEGVRVFYREQTREGFTWAQGAHDMMETWKDDSINNLTEFENTAMKNWDDLGSAWKDLMTSMLDMLISTLNRMVAEWLIQMAIMGIGNLIGGMSFGSKSMGVGGTAGTTQGGGFGIPPPIGGFKSVSGVDSFAKMSGDEISTQSETTVVQQTNNFPINALDGQDVAKFFQKHGNEIAEITGKRIERDRGFKKRIRGQRVN